MIDSLPRTIKHETSLDISIVNNSEKAIISSSKIEFVFNKQERIVKSFKVDQFELISKSFGYQYIFFS